MAKYKKNAIFVDPGIIESKAFNSFKKTKSAQIFMHFLRKRQWSQVGRGKERKWVNHNNGKIEFPYNEAVELGYSRRQFNEAKRELVEHGFIDVKNEGGIFDGDTALYSISDRWEKFGKPDFGHKTIPPDTRQDRGWSAYWKNLRQKNLSIKRRKKKLRIKRRKKKRI
jgi:hypothetical protein